MELHRNLSRAPSQCDDVVKQPTVGLLLGTHEDYGTAVALGVGVDRNRGLSGAWRR